MKRQPLNLEELADEIIRIEYSNYEIYHPQYRTFNGHSLVVNKDGVVKYLQSENT